MREEELICENCGESWFTEEKYVWRCLMCGKFVCNRCALEVDDCIHDVSGMVCREHLDWYNARLQEVR